MNAVFSPRCWTQPLKIRLAGSSTVPNIFVCVRGWPHASHGLCAHGVFVFLCLRSRLGQRAMQQLRWRAHSAELSRVLIVLDFPERERSIGTCFSNFGYPSVLISAPNCSGAAELSQVFEGAFRNGLAYCTSRDIDTRIHSARDKCGVNRCDALDFQYLHSPCCLRCVW